jgi:MFS transporter, AAHS family, 4-hydroxybenzoate transporter
MAQNQEPKAIDVGELVDRAPFVGLPLFVVLACVITLVLDGFDIQAIGYAAPAMVEDWGIDRKQLGPVFSASLIGMAIGGLAAGPIGDRYGRKPALILCVLLFGLATLLGAWAANLTQMGALRLIAGIGLGGALPNITALMSEYAPPRWRSLLVMLVITGVPIGGLAGGWVAVFIVPHYGWQAIFLLGGVMPLLLAVALMIWLPESARYLVKRGDSQSRLVALANRLSPPRPVTLADRFTLAEEAQPPPTVAKNSIGRLFETDLRRDTLAMWLVFFCSIFGIYAVLNWLPTMMVDAGFAKTLGSQAALYFNLGGIGGTLLVGLMIGKWGSRALLVGISLIAGVAALLIGWLVAQVEGGSAANAVWLGVVPTMIVLGAAIIALQCGMYAVVAAAYPTDCRSTGVGWAVGTGRLGGIVSAFLGTAVLGLGWHADAFFAIVAGVMILAAAGLLLLRRHLPAR